MSYQVLARKWRPQRFEDVVGQRAVTQTLRNAIKTDRLAHAFVFAGPRGVGKTTTARILARALNCEQGPTPEPCGHCDACIEIAEGRDMDVLEIDAATNTKIEDTRAVIIEGLAIPPVRDRYKIFIIDEVHQLSNHSFNALLKSIEEPPPNTVFIMATTEANRIPETILSRSQVYEFKTIASTGIAEQLRKIADAEGITVSDEALALLARAADGSMRDSETALDQVRAFAGDTITMDDVSGVLGLVGRDLLLDVLQAVVDEDGVAAFALAGRAVESGYDLKLVCREMSRVVRDLMVLSIDPARISDPDIAPEGERERLKTLATQFSREDLLRAFDVLTRAETDIRNAAEPRYHLEMALVRWIHLRKLAPLAELIEKLQGDPSALRGGPGPSGRGPVATPPRTAPVVPSRTGGRSVSPMPSSSPAAPSSNGRSAASNPVRPSQAAASIAPAAPAPAAPTAVNLVDVKDAFLSRIQQVRAVFYRTAVAQAMRIEAEAEAFVFYYAPVHRVMKETVEQAKTWLEQLATEVAGRHVSVRSDFAADAAPAQPAQAAGQPQRRTERELRAAVLADETVQALLGTFPAEIRTVEEIDRRKG